MAVKGLKLKMCTCTERCDSYSDSRTCEGQKRTKLLINSVGCFGGGRITSFLPFPYGKVLADYASHLFGSNVHNVQ